ncbi:MAG TPA: hypothetical protein PK729_19615, partial [Candidatus Hydrogenedentes bacterium]|nr:hypothetical protein [Candidatus Hydrogenedentota bacterium]
QVHPSQSTGISDAKVIQHTTFPAGLLSFLPISAHSPSFRLFLLFPCLWIVPAVCLPVYHLMHSSVYAKLALCCATFRGLKLLCVALYSQCEHKKGVVDPKI